MKLLPFDFKKLLNFKRLISNIIKQTCFLKNYFVASRPKASQKLSKHIDKSQKRNSNNISSIKDEFVTKQESKTPS